MLADKLSKLRTELKVSQTELSKRLGIPRTTYSGYENGSREPDYETLKKIADYFDVTTDFLLGHKTGQSETEQRVYAYGGFLDMTDEEKEEVEEILEFVRERNKKRRKLQKEFGQDKKDPFDHS
ncbi:helix-turn-helix domain-containing protein [Geomicrobium sp. JCM 19037]|uniref:helix-turn-helix domain-containing protein n=1 Tax=Geomicrobium sp. JCM 19037 TaxID=1460634 RepID=UPI0005A90807|nr:helix-turn-helix transcriptional regulator [Geomicrobium sp. JCM 19037]